MAQNFVAKKNISLWKAGNHVDEVLEFLKLQKYRACLLATIAALQGKGRTWDIELYPFQTPEHQPSGTIIFIAKMEGKPSLFVNPYGDIFETEENLLCFMPCLRYKRKSDDTIVNVEKEYETIYCDPIKFFENLSSRYNK